MRQRDISRWESIASQMLRNQTYRYRHKNQRKRRQSKIDAQIRPSKMKCLGISRTDRRKSLDFSRICGFKKSEDLSARKRERERESSHIPRFDISVARAAFRVATSSLAALSSSLPSCFKPVSLPAKVNVVYIEVLLHAAEFYLAVCVLYFPSRVIWCMCVCSCVRWEGRKKGWIEIMVYNSSARKTGTCTSERISVSFSLLFSVLPVLPLSFSLSFSFRLAPSFLCVRSKQEYLDRSLWVASQPPHSSEEIDLPPRLIARRSIHGTKRARQLFYAGFFKSNNYNSFEKGKFSFSSLSN